MLQINSSNNQKSEATAAGNLIINNLAILATIVFLITFNCVVLAQGHWEEDPSGNILNTNVGNVGIGNATAPKAQLEVKSTSDKVTAAFHAQSGQSVNVIEAYGKLYSDMAAFKVNRFGTGFFLNSLRVKSDILDSDYVLATYTGGSGNVVIKPRTSSHLALAVRGLSGQSGNLQEWQASDATALTVVDKDGHIGIGTAAPGTDALHVVGKVYVNGDIEYTGSLIGPSTKHAGPGASASIAILTKKIDQQQALIDKELAITNRILAALRENGIEVDLNALQATTDQNNPEDKSSRNRQELKNQHQDANSVDIPDRLLLSGNYPNPFNPTTRIDYQLPNDGFVSLKVYNMIGQLIKTLVNERQSTGSYSIVWDGTDQSSESVSSGTYIYQIQAGDFVQTRKMVLMK